MKTVLVLAATAALLSGTAPVHAQTATAPAAPATPPRQLYGAAAVLAAPVPDSDWRTVSPDNLLIIDTTKGRVFVELEPRAAPASVARIRELTNRGFYDGLKFHRVLTGFMAQTGDPLGTGEGGSDLPDVPGEFSFRRGRDASFTQLDLPNLASGVRGLMGSLPIASQPDAQMFVTADMKVDASGQFCPGVAGMARSNDVNSANSQFFLMTGANPSLNGTYTAFGRVVAGLDVVKALKPGSTTNNGTVADPDVMTRARIAASLPEAERPTVRVLNVQSPTFASRFEALQQSRGLNLSLCDVDLPSEVVGG